MIIVKNLTIKFNERKIYDNFNLIVKDGQKFVIKGGIGSGKTT